MTGVRGGLHAPAVATVHVHGGLRRLLAPLMSTTLALGPSAAGAVPVSERAAEVPLAVEGDAGAEATGEADAGAGSASATDESPAVASVADKGASERARTSRRPPPPRIDARSAPLRIAVGLGPTTAGSVAEREILARLEASVAASASPPTEVRRLRPGAGEPRAICRARVDDLVILIDYLPEREEPVLLPHECGLDQPLGVRSVAAADEPGLVGVLWEERQAMAAAGMEERRARTALSPRVRRGLIAGGAVVALGVALGVVLAASLRPRTAVITVGP